MDTNNIEINRINSLDRAVRIISEDGFFRAVAVKNSNSAKIAQNKHNYSEELALPLANVFSFANLTSAFLKGEERIIVDLQNYNNIGKIYAEAMPIGELRGFVTKESLNDSKILKVSRILYGEAEPITGIVEIISSNISEIFEEYLKMSEQVKSFVMLDATADTGGIIQQSGGLIVQAMPGASNSKITEVDNAIKSANSYCDYLSNDLRPDQILKAILPFEFKIIKSSLVDFFCRCSKDTFVNKLITLGIDEIKSMKNDNHNELVCQFCNNKYYIEDREFDNIIINLQAKNN